MSNERDFFTPEHIDQQVEQLFPDSAIVPPLHRRQDGKTAHSKQRLVKESQERYQTKRRDGEAERPERHLVRDLQGYYQTEQQQDLASLDRAWQQVAARLADQQERSRTTDKPSFAKMLRSPHERTHRMLKSVPERTEKGKIYRNLSLLAAVLVAALLVGGLLAVQSLSHRTGQTGSPRTTTSSQPVGTIVYTSPHIDTGGFTGLAWSPNGQRVAVATFGGVQIWDATTGKHKVSVPIPPDPVNGDIYVTGLAWSPDNQFIAIAARAHLLIASGQTGAIVHSYNANASTANISSVTGGSYLSSLLPASGLSGFLSAAWSPDSRFLAVSLGKGPDTNGSVTNEILNAQTGAQVFELSSPGTNIPTTLAWSSDGQYLAAFSNAFYGPEGSIIAWVWKISTRQIVFQQNTAGTANNAIAWQPGSHNLALFVSASNQTVALEIWNVEKNQRVQRYQTSGTNPLIWSPDGKTLAYSDGGHVILIDANSGKQIYVYHGKTHLVGALAWSPDGKYIASCEGVGISGSLLQTQPQPTPISEPEVVNVWVA